jgi:hypothetical protein
MNTQMTLGPYIVEIRNNEQGQEIVEAYVDNESNTPAHRIANEVLDYLLKEGFIDKKPIQTAVYNRYGVNIFRAA